MSLRDDSFRAMLGREPSSTEWQDIEQLQRATGMNKDEAFWGIIAYLYARTRPDIEARAQLQLVIESLKQFGERLDRGLQIDRLVTPVTTALRSALSEVGAGGDAHHLTATIEAAVRNAAVPPRPPLKDWFGEHLIAVLYTATALFTSGLLAVGVAYRTGTATATQSTRAADQIALTQLIARAGTIRAWAMSRNGQRVYAWGQLNRQSMARILSCGYPGWRRMRSAGYIVCYPNGNGHGFYVPAR